MKQALGVPLSYPLLAGNPGGLPPISNDAWLEMQSRNLFDPAYILEGQAAPFDETKRLDVAPPTRLERTPDTSIDFSRCPEAVRDDLEFRRLAAAAERATGAERRSLFGRMRKRWADLTREN